MSDVKSFYIFHVRVRPLFIFHEHENELRVHFKVIFS